MKRFLKHLRTPAGIALMVVTLLMAAGAWIALAPSPVDALTSLAILLPALGAAISGKGGKTMYGSVIVANMKEWSMSGFSLSPSEITAFGDTTYKKFMVADAGDPGTISFSGNWDPADTNATLFSTTCKAGTEITNLYLYANTSTFWRVAAGGVIIVTKCDAVSLARSGIGTISFEGKVSGAAMECVGTGT